MIGFVGGADYVYMYMQINLYLQHSWACFCITQEAQWICRLLMEVEAR